jgi:hypothetical protein
MNWVQRATELLEHLQLIIHQGWQYIVTFDESYFYWEQQWLPEEDEPGTRTRLVIYSYKGLFSDFLEDPTDLRKNICG